jgi:2-phosphosulfolactate phosphatase
VLTALGADGASPEAEAAMAAFDVVRERLADALASCTSGRELVSSGFESDVTIAAAYDVSGVVPVLEGDAFVDAATRSQES